MARRAFVYYLYGITPKYTQAGSNKILLSGIDGAEVSYKTIKGLSLVYSKILAKYYTEDSLECKIKDIKWLEGRAREHYQVQVAVAAHTETMLPLKFCTIFKTREGMIDFISNRYEEAKRSFNLS